jgi:hypothetical protein
VRSLVNRVCTKAGYVGSERVRIHGYEILLRYGALVFLPGGIDNGTVDHITERRLFGMHFIAATPAVRPQRNYRVTPDDGTYPEGSAEKVAGTAAPGVLARSYQIPGKTILETSGYREATAKRPIV